VKQLTRPIIEARENPWYDWGFEISMHANITVSQEGLARNCGLSMTVNLFCERLHPHVGRDAHTAKLTC
jgi:hypothetical protein